MPVSSEKAPPHGLQLVVDFVNTLDVSSGADELATPAQLGAWLADRGLSGSGDGALEIGAAEVRRAAELRAALRAVMHHHNHGDEPPPAAALEQVAAAGELSVCFDPGGGAQIAPRAPGFDGALAGLLVPVAHAAADGTWQRVKACDAASCQDAFYDHSRNRSGRWCDMAVCGNRTKVRTYRSKRTG